MSAPKHTPGPWVVEKYLVDKHEREVDSTARGNLSVRLRIVADESPMVVADMVAGGTADAHLIAAAPDLLEAWIDFLSAQKTIDEAGFMDNYTDAARARDRQVQAINKARAAIAKAEGRS